MQRSSIEVNPKKIKLKNSLLSNVAVFTDVIPFLKNRYGNIGIQVQPLRKVILELAVGKGLINSDFVEFPDIALFGFDHIKYEKFFAESIHYKLNRGYLNRSFTLGLGFRQTSFSGIIRNYSKYNAVADHRIEPYKFYSIKENSIILFIAGQKNVYNHLGIGYLIGIGNADQKMKELQLTKSTTKLDFQIRLHYYL